MDYRGEIEWIIADDCTPDPGYEDFVKRQFPYPEEVRFIKTPQNSGWGFNANHALAQASYPICLFLEDDYMLTQKLELTSAVHLLNTHHEIGLVRLDGITGHLGIMGIVQETESLGNIAPGNSHNRYHFFTLMKESRHLNIYSNRPHLKHRRFHDYYGKYDEGKKLGITETMFAHRVKNAMSNDPEKAPRIVVPMELCINAFLHIGESYQGTAFDKGNE